MRAKDVVIGQVYETRIGGERARVRVVGTKREVLYQYEIERGRKPRLLFVCQRESARPGELPLPKGRTAGALRPLAGRDAIEQAMRDARRNGTVVAGAGTIQDGQVQPLPVPDRNTSVLFGDDPAPLHPHDPQRATPREQSAQRGDTLYALRRHGPDLWSVTADGARLGGLCSYRDALAGYRSLIDAPTGPKRVIV